MKVFLSSTYTDLIEHRKTAHDALEQLGLHVIWMEAFGARPEESTKACLKEVEDSDLFIGIYAHRYGYIPKGAKASITEQEFDHAQKLGKPIFGFIVNEDHAWLPKFIEHDKKTNLDAFLGKVKKQPVEFFTTPDNLANNIASSIGHYLSEHKPTPDSPLPTPVKPTGSTLPYQPFFFGRTKELEIIKSALYPDSRTWGALIDGPGGIGKTALAIKAAHLAPANLFDRKIFITAKVRELTPEGEKQIKDFSRDDYFSILNELALELGEEGIPRLAPDERTNPLRMAMIGKKTLIVFDNLETLLEDERIRLFQFLSRLPQGNKAIVTSRRRADVDARVIRLDRLSADDALALMSELAKNNARLSRENQQARRNLYEITNGNPLLIKWVCGQLGREGSAMHTIAEACAYIENAPKGNDPLEYIFGDLLDTFTESETKVLAALTHFSHPAKINWITEMTNLVMQMVETSLQDLTDRSILLENTDERSYYLPPLAAQFIRTRRNEFVNNTANSLTNRAYSLIMEYGYRNYEGFKILESEWPSIQACFKYLLLSNNERLQIICDALTFFMEFTGKWDELIWLFSNVESCSLARNDIVNAGWRTYEITNIYIRRNQISESSLYLLRTKAHWKNLERQEKAFLYQLEGKMYSLEKNPRRAIRAFNNALSILEWSQPNNLDTAIILNDLASVYMAMSDFKKAQEIFEQALEISLKINDKISTTYITSNLAELASLINDWSTAEQLTLKCLEFDKEIGYKEGFAKDYLRMANIYLYKKLPNESLEYTNKAIEIFMKLQMKDELNSSFKMLELINIILNATS